jgi:hypothetical protein
MEAGGRAAQQRDAGTRMKWGMDMHSGIYGPDHSDA